MKKLLGLLLAFALIMGVVPSSFAASGIKIVVNGKVATTDVEPQIIRGQVFVPLRFIGEIFGAKVTWDANKREAIIETDEMILTASNLPIVKGKALVPLREISEKLNLPVVWDGQKRQVILTVRSNSNEQLVSELRKVWDINIEAMHNEDVDLYMSVIQADEEDYNNTLKIITETFDKFDVVVTTDKFEFVELLEGGTIAKVKVIQTNRNTNGEEYQSHVLTTYQYFKKDNGKWYINSTELIGLEIIDK